LRNRILYYIIRPTVSMSYAYQMYRLADLRIWG